MNGAIFVFAKYLSSCDFFTWYTGITDMADRVASITRDFMINPLFQRYS
jgi:hypothetical protein